MLIEEDRSIDLFIASRIGSFKHLKFHTDTAKNNKKFIENLIEIKSLQKDDSITCMAWGNTDQTEILMGKKNQQIQVYNTKLDAFTKSYTADFGDGHIVGLGRCKRKLLAAVSSGVVRVWSKKEEIVVDTGGKLDRMRLSHIDPTMFATGGEENDLKLWRIGEKTPLFSAKNLAHDQLQLRQPVWVSDVAFLADTLVAVCSRHGYVRLYDTRAQRRPVCNVTFEKMAATCLAPSFSERAVLCGFGRGQLHQIDLRQSRLDKGYKGCIGAVTDVSVLGSKYIVSTSLDRHIRVHDYNSKEVVYKQYLTSKLSCVLVQTETSTPLRKTETEIKEENQLEGDRTIAEVDEMDELFDNMETVGEKKRKTKLPAEESEAKRNKPSTEGSTVIEINDEEEKEIKEEDENAEEERIMKLLKSTEKQKRRMEKKKREKKAKSVFHNA